MAVGSGSKSERDSKQLLPFASLRAAVAIALLGLAAFSSCRLSPAASDTPVETSPAPLLTPTPTAVASATPEAAPAWVADLAGQLECDGPINTQMGAEVVVRGEPLDPVATPDEALGVLLKPGVYAWLPAGGFEPTQTEGRWALYSYIVGGRLKVIAVGTNHFPGVPEAADWEVVGVRACDPSEFDPKDGLTDGSTIWIDAGGRRVRADRIFSRPGPGHCGWEGITFLYLDDKLYLRDPRGLLADQTARPFRVLDALPADAVDTGLRTPKLHLFTVPDERVVYVRRSDGTIERWGRGSDEIGCA